MAKETESKETPKVKKAGITEKQKQDWKERKLAILNEKQTATSARAASRIAQV